jgi:hypothetical protein
MRLARDGVEYAHWTISGLPDTAIPTPEVYLAGRWHPMEWAEATDAGWVVRVLVAGPDVQTGTAVALPLGRTVPRIRLTDAPEAIVRDSTAAIEVT